MGPALSRGAQGPKGLPRPGGAELSPRGVRELVRPSLAQVRESADSAAQSARVGLNNMSLLCFPPTRSVLRVPSHDHRSNFSILD